MRHCLLRHDGMMAESGCHFDVQVEIRKNTGKPVPPILDDAVLDDASATLPLDVCGGRDITAAKSFSLFGH